MKYIYVLLATAVLLFVSADQALAQASEQTHSRYFYENKGTAIWDVATPSKSIAITFDDGPSDYTPQILEVLDQYNAKATFFVVGTRAKENPEILKQTSLAGHEIANHTYDHGTLKGVTSKVIQHDLNKANEVIKGITNKEAQLFRPPGGYYNDRIVETADQEGFKVVMWSWHQDTYDWKRPGADKIAAKVLSNARNGDVILFHDGGGNRSQTVMALKQILPELQKQGYKFVTVSELLQLDPRYQFLDRLAVNKVME
ncbi:polysaccharide deacetylase family protein [Halobacillus massiliensis]|uniref:polysaccharide deacetylase family protein n=1 Tax=Halobacillus massiliensis TaxID=1926286 RepID=UPI0009E6373C|nr:polysaccharide deacetylase family protein [Halobacillus massiliensis]